MAILMRGFLNSLRYASCHAALSSFHSSGRITADMRFAPRLGAHPNCSLRSQLRLSAKRYAKFTSCLIRSWPVTHGTKAKFFILNGLFINQTKNEERSP